MAVSEQYFLQLGHFGSADLALECVEILLTPPYSRKIGHPGQAEQRPVGFAAFK